MLPYRANAKTRLNSTRQADFAEKESGVNSMAFVERKSGSSGNGNKLLTGDDEGGVMLLATGGEDGVLRVWELRADVDAPSECWLLQICTYFFHMCVAPLNNSQVLLARCSSKNWHSQPRPGLQVETLLPFFSVEIP